VASKYSYFKTEFKVDFLDPSFYVYASVDVQKYYCSAFADVTIYFFT